MVFEEEEPLRGDVAPERRSSSTRGSMIVVACISTMLLVVIVFTSSSSKGTVGLEESSVELFKTALASQQADLARHRKTEEKDKVSAAKGEPNGRRNKGERLSDARLFKDAVKEQHAELAKQRAAEAKARDLARNSAGAGSKGQKGSLSDASLLKDALKEQHAESKKVASARIKIKAAAKALNAKLEAEEKLKAAQALAKKTKESSDEKLFQDALKEQHDENNRETAALKKDLIIAAKKSKEIWENTKKARHAKISHELREILGAQDTLHVKKAAPPKSKLLKDALKEQHEDKVKAAAKAMEESKEEAARRPAVPKHLTATNPAGHQVLSTAAEKSLVAFLTEADHKIRHKASPEQEALGRELQAARLHKAAPHPRVVRRRAHPPPAGAEAAPH